MDACATIQTDLDDVVLARLEQEIVRAKNIVLIVHKSPDGDALGAMLSFYLALTHMGKRVTPASYDPAPDAFRYLPGVGQLVHDFDPLAHDLVITMDCGDIKQTKFNEKYPILFAPKEERAHTLVKIDHHAYGGEFGDIQIVPTDMPASAYIMTRIYEKLSIRITPDMATCLLTGLMTDTGSFKHSNTSPQALRMASRLLRYGANLGTISRNVFRHTPIPAMHLWGRILKNIQVNQKGITLAMIKEEDFAATGTEAEDLTGVVDYINSVPNALFSLMLSERGDTIKGSLRTVRDDVNVAKIASAFGGGGHVKAAGFQVQGKLSEERVWRITS